MKKKILLLYLTIVGGSISCAVGVEYQRYPWEEGRKEKIACQLVRKAHPRRSSYLACEDVKRNHMTISSTKHENLLQTKMPTNPLPSVSPPDKIV
uniref:Lipoprotein n=1 Tax=Manihot esculenta TaxID=3983 RepID=A0A2C9VI40_MANES